MRADITSLPDDPRHGTNNGYMNLRCRCDACKAAGRQANLEQKQKRLARGLPDGDRRHGTCNGYTNWGCRCGACRSAWRDYSRIRYAKRADR